MDVILVHKIYQRPALVNAEPPQPAGYGNTQLVHDGGRRDAAYTGERLQHLGDFHPRDGGITVPGGEEVSHSERSEL